MAANPGKETIGAHANCANALNKSIIPLLELLLVLLLLFPVILLRVSKEECFVGIFVRTFPFRKIGVCLYRAALSVSSRPRGMCPSFTSSLLLIHAQKI
jgi:hypothetical protein